METSPSFSSCGSQRLPQQQQQASGPGCRRPLDSDIRAVDGCCSSGDRNSSSAMSSSGSNDEGGRSSGSSPSSIAMTVSLSPGVSSMSDSWESFSSNTVRGERHGTSGRCWLSPGGVAVPPAPPSSPESLLVLPAHMKSVPSVLTLHSAAAAAAALASGSSSSLVPIPPDHTHLVSGSSSSISTCSSHDRRSSCNTLSPMERTPDVSSPYASSLSPDGLASSASPSCIKREFTTAPPPECLSDVCVQSIAFASSPPGSSVRPDAAAAAAASPSSGAAATAKAIPTPTRAVLADSAKLSPIQLRGENVRESHGVGLLSGTAETYPTSNTELDCEASTFPTPATGGSTTAAVGASDMARVSAPSDSAVSASHDSNDDGGARSAAAAAVPSATAVAGVLETDAATASTEKTGAAPGPRGVLAAAEHSPPIGSLQSEEKPSIVVLDTGAFLRLQQLGGSNALLRAEQQLLSRRRQQQHSTTSKRPRRIQFVAPASVLMEIRDARSRAHALQQQQWAAAAADTDLPLVMTATEVDKRWARSFAAKTGDLRALSSTDLDVIALTYMLQRQTGQVQHLRDRPVESVCVQPRCSDNSSRTDAAATTRVGEDASPGEKRIAAGTIITERKAPGTNAAEVAGAAAAQEEATEAEEAAAAAEEATAAGEEGTAISAERVVEVVEGIRGGEGVDVTDKTIEEIEEKRFSGEGTEETEEAKVHAAAAAATSNTKTSGVEPEAARATYEGLGKSRGGAANGGYAGGVKETRNLVEFNSDDDNDGEGEWICLDNIEQLKRNATACMYEEDGFPSVLPRHDAIFAAAEASTSGKKDTDAVSLGEQVYGEKEHPSWAGDNGIIEVSSSKTDQRKAAQDGEEVDFRVACKTTDYSVQNVLLHMGLNVLAVDGYAVRSLKTWALLCRACQHVTRDTSHLFCPKCGQHAVDRVPVSFNGKEYVVFDNRKKKCTRGLIHTLPKPKGGRHEKQLVLSEDQLMMGGRDRLLRHQQRLWESENAEHNFFGSDSAMDPASWYARTRTRTGRPATGVQAPHVVVGLGPGNPNSNRWMKKKHGTATKAGK